MRKIAINEIESRASVDVSTSTEPKVSGPYRLDIEVTVYADSHEQAVAEVERRLSLEP